MLSMMIGGILRWSFVVVVLVFVAAVGFVVGCGDCGGDVCGGGVAVCGDVWLTQF